MRRDFVRSVVPALALFAAVLVPAKPSFAQTAETSDDDVRTCSLAGVAGNWSMTDSGTIVSPALGQRVAVGKFRLTPNGNLVNGVATSSLNGTITAEAFFGTYSVSPDCTGTIQVKIFSCGGTTPAACSCAAPTSCAELFEVSLNTAFDDQMHQMRALFTKVVTPDGTQLATVIGLAARKQ